MSPAVLRTPSQGHEDLCDATSEPNCRTLMCLLLKICFMAARLPITIAAAAVVTARNVGMTLSHNHAGCLRQSFLGLEWRCSYVAKVNAYRLDFQVNAYSPHFQVKYTFDIQLQLPRQRRVPRHQTMRHIAVVLRRATGQKNGKTTMRSAEDRTSFIKDGVLLKIVCCCEGLMLCKHHVIRCYCAIGFSGG